MRAAPVVILKIGPEHVSQVRLVEDDDAIQALPAGGADHALDIRVLPRAHRRGHDFSDAHGGQAALERGCPSPKPGVSRIGPSCIIVQQ